MSQKALIFIAENVVLHAEKTKKEMFAKKEIDSQPHKAKSANAHIAFLPTLKKLNKDF